MRNYLVLILAVIMTATLPFAAYARDNNIEAAWPIEKATSPGYPNGAVSGPYVNSPNNAAVNDRANAQVGNAAEVRSESATSFGGLVQPIK
jgi:hypothetical protein